MKSCSIDRDRLLIADTADLEGTSGTELADHVASCPECAEAAARILRLNRALDEALSHAPTLDVDAVLARASMRSVSGTRSRARWGGLSALVAAAALTGLLLWPGWGSPPGDPSTTPTRSYSDYEPVSGNLVVLPTTNPDITVLWLY